MKKDVVLGSKKEFVITEAQTHGPEDMVQCTNDQNHSALVKMCIRFKLVFITVFTMNLQSLYLAKRLH